MTKQTILVELDAILDTRLGTLAQLCPDYVRGIEPSYWDRTSDDFEKLSGGRVTNEAFKSRYATRDKETLRNSVVTPVCHLLGIMTRTLQRKRISGLGLEDIVVVINTHPYKLDDDELTHIKEGVSSYISLGAKVETVSYPIEEITPALLKERYDAYVLYDYNAWDGHHRTALMKLPISDITLIIPELYLVGREPKEEDLFTPEGDQLDPFKVLALTMLEWMIIEHHTAALYSMCHPAHDFTKSLYSSFSTP